MKRLTFASALLTTNVPNARDDVTVLTLTESGATTTVIEVDKGIDTLVITTDQAGDRASRATLRARGKIAGAEVTLLGINALVVVTVVVPSIVVTPSILVIVAVRSLGWSRRLCGGGRSRGRVATEGSRAPTPALIALRRGEGIRWLVRSTAALPAVPGPMEGAVSVMGWVGGVVRSSVGKTDVLGFPSETGVSAPLSTPSQRTHLNWFLPQSFPPPPPPPWARTKGIARTRRAMRVMSDI